MDVSVSKSLPVFFSNQKLSFSSWIPKLDFGFFIRSDQGLIDTLKTVHPLKLKQVLQDVFTNLIEEGRMQEALPLLEELAKQITYETMQEASEQDLGKELKSLVKEAEYYQTLQKEPSSRVAKALTATVNALISLIESINAAFGVRELLKPSESAVHDTMIKSQKITTLIFFLSVLTPVLGAVMVGEVLLAVTVLSVVWPLIKPMSFYLPPGAECWTKEVQNGTLVAYGRKESLDEIAGVLKMNRHAILVGPSRVGKSLTAKALAGAIERGEYPELKGKVLFRFNTADLIDQQSSFVGGGDKTLHQISEAMGRHRNDIILVLDEIHMASKNNQKMADQLKPFLDEGGEFPHVIGITTEEEYQKYVKENQAFSLRFDKVTIANTSEDETLMILGKTLLNSPSKPLVSEGTVLRHIYERSNQGGAPQPASALKLLKKCIQSTERTQRSPLEKKVLELSHKICAMRSQEALRLEKQAQVQDQIKLFEKQLKELQKELEFEKKEREHLCQAKRSLDQMKLKMRETVLRTSKVIETHLSLHDKKELNFFALLRVLGPFLESTIQEKSKKLGLKMGIDFSLVDEMV